MIRPRKVLGLLMAVPMVLAACAAPPAAAPAAPAAPVEVTRIVEVTRVVEVTAAPAATVAAAPTPAPAAPVASSGFGETLKAIKARGKLICGVNSQVPGFGFVDSAGAFSGFDIDYCKALAAAIFNDVNKVEYRPLTAEQRFAALQSGEIDVLIRNTTWTLTRDTDNGANFVATTFYDGQGIMVPKDSNITKLEELDGATICVQKGTTTELNLADQMAARNLQYTPAVFEDANGTFGAYAEGRCDAVTTDKSGLVSRRSVLPNPDDHVILDVTLSKEPLGPMVRHGDDQWFDIVQWTVFATFAAEEFGITSENVDSVAANDTRPEVRRLLGADEKVDLGAKLGLSKDWAVNVIKAVGNYGEIYDRNLGPNTKTAIPRGINNLYTQGGLLYSPPFR
ncbi:MAG: amino acid ABC transporter substrate-binding protein [Chloroflexi bacterium]|uniref:Amino acid ABC transporter substrate-binding protein n=2 Tax=Candidatus Thermofonsia Clade 3 TaxID=2364209 RepID=A0A2M8QFE6_9CHLR|nr:MAG: amino acid ABC transporter substrate-binding protein [Candidatus Thermofonsia Clade 3 bacterium]RMG66097.1 MAG: amino acid ABC transporter substrate-binding protein [Chloroflexota bacterium]